MSQKSQPTFLLFLRPNDLSAVLATAPAERILPKSMPLEFTLDQRLVGFSVTTAGPGERVGIVPSDLIGPADATRLSQALEQIQSVLLSFIPGLPAPSVTDHLLVIIRPDLSGIAYPNELSFTGKVKINRAVQAGAPVFWKDITDVSEMHPGIEVPDDCAVLMIRSEGWRRSLYFDFGPLDDPPRPRSGKLEQVLARQAVLLLGIPRTADDSESSGRESLVDRMARGYQRLLSLLNDRCEDESEFQELLENHPWMLGGQYEAVMRHKGLDDQNIPDFTAIRAADKCHDILELKQPFMKCFKSKGTPSSAFNDAWDQAGRYLTFTRRWRDYLREQKGLRFENPRCTLIAGYNLSEDELREVREKESLTPGLSVLTYDQLATLSQHVLFLMRLSEGDQAKAPG